MPILDVVKSSGNGEDMLFRCFCVQEMYMSIPSSGVDNRLTVLP